MTTQTSRSPRLQKHALECGTYRSTGTMYLQGEYQPRPCAPWPHTPLQRLCCNEATARLVDQALANMLKEGSSEFPSDHISARSLLIERGSRYCLGGVEQRFSEMDSGFCGGVYVRQTRGTRPWIPVVVATNWLLAAMAALLLDGIDSGGVSSAPPPGPHVYGASLLFGCPPSRNIFELYFNADGETEFEAEEFPKKLLLATTILARRIPSSAEKTDQLKEVA